MLVDATATACCSAASRRWPRGRYSALAGFVEPGESLEEAVAREVLEEAGVEVGTPRYIASQPWPFPTSLMLGFIAPMARPASRARATSELEDVRWFERAERGGRACTDAQRRAGLSAAARDRQTADGALGTALACCVEVTLEGWIFMVGLRVFDVGALIVWLVWFFRLRDDDDDGGRLPAAATATRPSPRSPRGPGGLRLPLPDVRPWHSRRRDHRGDRRPRRCRRAARAPAGPGPRAGQRR